MLTYRYRHELKESLSFFLSISASKSNRRALFFLMISERMLWISECVFIRTRDSLYTMVMAPFLKRLSIKMTLFALADWLVSREDASVRQFGLRPLFHFPVYISMGVDPVRGGSKWKRRAYRLICQTIAKSSFFALVSHTSPFLLEAVIQSRDKPVWEIMPKIVWWYSDFMLIFSTEQLCVHVCERERL